ncbi:unnamed protein product [Sphagnum jensenii]
MPVSPAPPRESHGVSSNLRKSRCRRLRSSRRCRFLGKQTNRNVGCLRVFSGVVEAFLDDSIYLQLNGTLHLWWLGRAHKFYSEQSSPWRLARPDLRLPVGRPQSSRSRGARS